LLRILARDTDASVMTLVEHQKQELQAAKLALFETMQALTSTTGALEKALPHAVATLNEALGGEEEGEGDDDSDI
jgi:hypothetical protein